MRLGQGVTSNAITRKHHAAETRRSYRLSSRTTLSLREVSVVPFYCSADQPRHLDIQKRKLGGSASTASTAAGPFAASPIQVTHSTAASTVWRPAQEMGSSSATSTLTNRFHSRVNHSPYSACANAGFGTRKVAAKPLPGLVVIESAARSRKSTLRQLRRRMRPVLPFPQRTDEARQPCARPCIRCE